MADKIKNIDKLRKDPFNYANALSVTKLVDLLRTLSEIYYNTGESILSDEVYDMLKDILIDKDPNNPYLNEIGAPPKGTKNIVILPHPMSSLDKIKADTARMKEIEENKKKYCQE